MNASLFEPKYITKLATSMAVYGRIDEYLPSQDWSEYVERLEQYFVANGVNNADKKRSILLTVIGANMYSLVRNLVSPSKPTDKTYEELTRVMKDHLQPKPLIIAERYKFHKRNQKEGESISEYVAALRQLAHTCDFQAFLDDALRDRLVCGIRNEAIQRRLLSVTDLNLQKAIEKAVAIETATKDALSMAQPASDKPVINRVSDGKSRGVSKSSSVVSKPCYRCGGEHNPQTCRFKDEYCNYCQKLGHISKMCLKRKADQRKSTPGVGAGARAGRQVKPRNTNQLKTDNELDVDNEAFANMYQIKGSVSAISSNDNPYNVIVKCNDVDIVFEIDTAASYTVIGENTYKEKLSFCKLCSCSKVLKTYNDQTIDVLGEITCSVKYGDQCKDLNIIVCKGNKASLMGRNWLKCIKLNWAQIFSVKNDTKLDSILSKFGEVFSDTPGEIKDFEVDIPIKPDATPIFRKAYSVPYPYQERVKKQLERDIECGIYTKVEHSDWASPQVCVLKPDGKSVRLCGDYKVTVNQVMDKDPYSLPSQDDLFTGLSGKKYFSKIDLANAFHQLKLSENSKKLLTVNTIVGLLQCNKMPYGITVASQVFQKVMDTILSGLKDVKCSTDDILLSSVTKDEAYELLEQVLSRLQKYNVKARMSKCVFVENSVEYVGHTVSESGIHPSKHNIEALLNAPAPTNVSELKAFLGLVNYHQKYIKNLSSILYPFYKLLKKNVKWNWSNDCQETFVRCKHLLTTNDCLTHYDLQKPIVLACDASSVGVGCTMSHIMPDGSERPIAMASRTLNAAERNYGQIDKEALSIIFGVKKFHKFLFGKKFTIVTDHKSLTLLFGPKTGIPQMAAARLQRWSYILSGYDYDIKYRRSENHGNADGLSRLPDPTAKDDRADCKVNSVICDSLPIKHDQIKRETLKDPTLVKVYQFVQSGWPNHVTEPNIVPYFRRRNELSIENGVILWGIRVVIPPRYRNSLLKELHFQHHGIVRMKMFARGYLWYPNLDSDIEDLVRSCEICQSQRNMPAEAPANFWPFPTSVFERVHIDYLGPYNNVWYLVLVDAYSKWLEVKPMKTTTSERTIEELRSIFATFGLPKQLVSDNGPQFVSVEFKNFVDRNGIKHIHSAFYKPASNGAAERMVQIVKSALNKYVVEGRGGSLRQRLDGFLLTYRLTPQSTTGQSPTDIVFKQKVRCKFDLLKPDLKSHVIDKQEKTMLNCDRQLRTFYVGDTVRVRNPGRNHDKCKWFVGVVTKVLGSRNYEVKVGSRTVKAHIDQLISAVPEHLTVNNGLDNVIETACDSIVIPENVVHSEVENVNVENVNEKTVNVDENVCKTPNSVAPQSVTPVVPRRSLRNVKLPVHLRNEYVL